MTPKEKSEALFKYFHDKLFKEGYPRDEIKKLSIEFSLYLLEECCRPRSIEYLNEVIHETKLR